MSRANPLHIILLLLLLLAIGIYQLRMLQGELQQEERLYKESLLIAQELSAYKQQYTQGEDVVRNIEKSLKERVLKNVDFRLLKKEKSLTIRAKKIGFKALSYFMNKILNSNYIIKRVEIRVLDDKSASLEVKIQW